MEKITVTRKELYDMVWSEPLYKLAKKFNITSTKLSDKCKKHNIPLPSTGYWQKLKLGITGKQEELKEFMGDNRIVLAFSIKDGEYVDETLTPMLRIKTEIETDKNLSLTVPKKLTNPDNLILSTKEHYYNLEFNKREYSRRLYPESSYLDINSTPKNFNRALRIMDTFIKIIKARGHDIKIQSGQTSVEMYTTKTDICIIEKHKVVKERDGHSSRELVPTGKLAFKAGIYFQKEWTDTKTPLEKKLSMIVAWLEFKALELKSIWDKNREEEQIRKEQEKKEKEALELKNKELSKFKVLLDEVERWNKAMIIRDYINFIESQNIRELEWIKWAKDKADWFDPVIGGKDKITGAYEEFN